MTATFADPMDSRGPLPDLPAMVRLPEGTGMTPAALHSNVDDHGRWSHLFGPAARQQHVSVFDSRRRRKIVIMGDRGGSPSLVTPDVWALDLAGDLSWRELRPAGAGPVARLAHAAVYDSRSDRIILVGGASGNQGFSDAWALELSGEVRWRTLPTTGSGPGARAGHAAVYDPARHRMIVSGGLRFLAGGAYDFPRDVWQLDLETGVWSEVVPQGARTPIAWYHAAVWDAREDRMLVVGGLDSAFVRVQEPWVLSFEPVPAWSPLTPSGSLQPPPRYAAAVVFEEGANRVHLFGGIGSGSFLGDSWTLQLGEQPSWSAVQVGGGPSARATSAVFDSDSSRLVLFGGDQSADSPLGDTWQLRMAGAPVWSRVADPYRGPSLRQHASVHDPLRGRMIVFGGYDANGSSDAVWQVTLGDRPLWTRLFPSGTPPRARFEHSAIYDPVRDRVVIFGGKNGLSSLSDAWALELSPSLRWVRLPDADAGLYGHSAIYDPVRDRMIVFGGYSGGYSSTVRILSLARQPVWRYPAISGATPTPRHSHTAIYDPVRDRMVIFGGKYFSQKLADTWALRLSGTPAWSSLPGAGPRGRLDHVAIHDPRRDRMVVDGGDSDAPANELGLDTWAFSLSGAGGWTRLNPDGLLPANEARMAETGIYDPEYDRLVCFGGEHGAGTTQRTVNETRLLSWSPNARAAASRYSVVPGVVGNDGFATIQVRGATPRTDPAAVLLCADGTRIPARWTFMLENSLLEATFELRDAAIGDGDLLITGGGVPAESLGRALVIEAGREPALGVELLGPPRIRVERDIPYEVRVTNQSNQDAMMVPLFIGGIPVQQVSWRLDAQVVPPPGSTIDWTQHGYSYPAADGTELAVTIPRLRPGETKAIRLHLFVDRVGHLERFNLRAETRPPLISRLPSAPGALVRSPGAELDTGDDMAATCLTKDYEFILAVIGGTNQSAWAPCAVQMAAAFAASWRVFLAIEPPYRCGTNSTWAGCLAGTAWAMAGPVADLYGVAEACGRIVEPPSWTRVVSILNAAYAGYQVFSCNSHGYSTSKLPVDVIGSFDPNDKYGPAGGGVARHVGGGRTFSYRVSFENLPTATAAAQQVVVTDVIDRTRLDLATFAIGPIVVGSRELHPGAGVRDYQGTLDLRPEINLLVRVRAGLDVPTGVVRWIFDSLDPLTQLPTTDLVLGLLPPNLVPPRGEGSVSFTIRPRAGLPLGTMVRNKATIVFDANDPIETPEWSNVIDSSPPTSVLQLAGYADADTALILSWQGEDAGSGLKSFSIFASADGGPYRAWRMHTTAATDTFHARRGIRYAFISSATDSAGNVEPPHGMPDVTPTLIALASARVEGTAVFLEWEVRDGASRTWTVYRSESGVDWRAIGLATAEGETRLVFEDRSVEKGLRYGYRIGSSGEDLSSAIFLDVPGDVVHCALSGILPNPSPGSPRVSFALPDRAPSRLEVFDVAGRLLASRDVGRLGAGHHQLRLDESERWPAGVYLVRLSHPTRVVRSRFVLTR